MRYFLVTFYRKAGGQIDEQVSVTKRVRNSDLTSSNIIMDFGKRKIDKCVGLFLKQVTYGYQDIVRKHDW